MNHDDYEGLAQALFEESSEAQFLLDPAAGEGAYHYPSPAVELIAGRPADHFGKQMGRWRDLIPPQDQPRWDEGLERRRRGQATEDEYRLVWPDGSVRWVRDRARAVRALAGRTTWLYGVFTDVTERKKAEGPLHRLAELVDAAE